MKKSIQEIRDELAEKYANPAGMKDLALSVRSMMNRDCEAYKSGFDAAVKLMEERAAKLVTAVTIEDCNHCLATQLLNEYNQLRGGA